jgi:hypothetical protein
LGPSTQQPQAIAARQIAALKLPDALVLLPFGNDGVGVPGPFIAAAPDAMRILLLRPGDLPPLGADMVLVRLHADAASSESDTRALGFFGKRKYYVETGRKGLIIRILERKEESSFCEQRSRKTLLVWRGFVAPALPCARKFRVWMLRGHLRGGLRSVWQARRR